MSPLPRATWDRLDAYRQQRGTAAKEASTVTDWLEWRRQGIGASDVAGILGLSPWASPYSVWADKRYGNTDDDTAVMEFGRRAEPMIAPWFHERTGLHVGGAQTRCEHPQHSWRRCTIDGYVYDPAELDDDDRFHFHVGALEGVPVLGVYEAKTTSAPPKEWDEGGIPVHYQCQAQWTMHVTGVDRVWFAVLHLAFGRPELRVYELARDDTDIDVIVKAVDAFWHNHVLTAVPPDTDAHPATTYATKHLGASPGDMMLLPPEAAGWVHHLAALKADRKRLDGQIDGVENAIRAALDDCTEGYHDGQLIVSHREQTRRAIDADALRKRLPRVAAKFTTSSTYRVLRTHHRKDT